jgi:hypothetical protein
MNSHARSALWIVLAATACGKSDSTRNNDPTSVTVITGEGQAGTVGNVLPVQVVFKVSGPQGGVAGVSISAAVPTGQGGSASPQNGTTDAGGLFTVTWTLGATVGPQTLVATTGGGLSATAHAIAGAGAAAAVTAVSDAFQFVVVGHAVGILPVVKVTDAFGNGLAGVAVTFEALSDGETLTGTDRTTDANGRATLGSWTIGPNPFSYQIRGKISTGAAAVFEAKGIPASVTAVAGTGQSANAGTVVATAPAVRAVRDDGSGVANVAVTFTVIDGGGRVDGGTTVTLADGVARPTRWVLGPTPGPNHLSAQVLGRDPVTFTATGVTAIASASAAASPTSQNSFFGNYVGSRPAVRVTDAIGNPVAGSPVTFAVTQGGGTLVGPTQATDFDGRATVAAWRMGSTGPQSLTATAGALAPVTFTASATAPPASTFRITVRFNDPCTGCRPPTPAQQAAFDAAVARWTTLIVAGGPPYLVFENATPCAPNITGETVDGVVIYAHLLPIDGVNGILGQSGPCILRDEGLLTAEGIMEFDTADLAALEASGQLNQVILHEMGHVLGFGTIWDFPPINSFLVGNGTGDPWFNGASAQGAFFGSLAAGRTFPGNTVPVEAGGGAGTAYSHWRESLFGNELMTGFLNTGTNPLSAISVAQFRDLGYTVNDAAADVYTLPISTFRAAPENLVQLLEGRVRGDIIVINREGHEVRRIPRR